MRLLPRYRVWQSASSTPTRAAAGFSWTSPAALEAVAPTAHYFYLAPQAFVLAYLPLTQPKTFSFHDAKLGVEVRDE